jgi:hypothetical protein
MVSRCLRRTILSLTAATIVIGQQILAKAAIAQTQESLDPPVQPAKWYTYQQPYEIEGVTVHSNANDACKAYESAYEVNGTQYQIKFQRVGLYPSNRDIPDVNCWMKLEPNGGDEYPVPMTVWCPNTNDIYNTYVYTGGTDGVCILASIYEQSEAIIIATENNSNGQPYTDKPLMGARLLPAAITAARLAQASKLYKTIRATVTQGQKPKASDFKKWAELQGWKPSQTPNGPLKYVDEKGVTRLTIKQGSPRTPQSETPHVELRNANGNRIDIDGNLVTQRSSQNHTQIEYDLY